MIFNYVRVTGAALAVSWLVSCGGGGGNPGVPAPPNPPLPPGPSEPPATLTLKLTEVAMVGDAVHLTAPAGDPRQFIVERRGRIHILDNGALRSTPFLDISARTAMTGEGGLLSMAFDPQFGVNGYLYIVYTDPANNIVVERLSVGATPNVADPASALEIIRIPHPGFTNHYGGLLAFGADGMLYLGTGDGGGSGDPNRNAQDANSLLGKLLRIDVRGASVTQRYRLPANNPFVAQSGKRGEIWALGLRNPWRYSFDNDQLYIADVGQSEREEVNIQDAGAGGLNYGWNIMEGTSCFGGSTCNAAGLTLPAYQYEHGAGKVNGCSITGGEVYRGTRIPALAGNYFFSDYCKGFLKSLRHRSDGPPTVTTWTVADVGAVVSFGRDGSGELYMIASSGRIYRIDSGG